MPNPLTQTSVSLSDVDREIVNQLSEQKGLNNFSSALRMIIREWDEMRSQRWGITEAGRRALAELDEIPSSAGR